MKHSVIASLLAGAALTTALLSGCGKTQATMTPQEQSSFGHYGQPMPEAAKKYMQEHQAQMAPGAAAQKK